jgi:hypothetical protein
MSNLRTTTVSTGSNRRLAVLLLLAQAPAWAMGPAAPFTPPRAAAPVVQAATTTTTSTAASARAPQAAASAAALGLPDAALQGVRTGPHPVALLEGRWWGLGSGPEGRRITAIDSRGIWITLGPSLEPTKTLASQQRLWLLPNAVAAAVSHPPPVLTASAHGARP